MGTHEEKNLVGPRRETDLPNLEKNKNSGRSANEDPIFFV